MRLFVAVSWCDGMFREEKNENNRRFSQISTDSSLPKTWADVAAKPRLRWGRIVRNERRRHSCASHSWRSSSIAAARVACGVGLNNLW